MKKEESHDSEYHVHHPVELHAWEEDVAVAWEAAAALEVAEAVVIAEGVGDEEAEHPSADADPGPAIPGAGVAEEGTSVDFAEWISDCTVEVGDLAPDAKPSDRLPPWIA